MSDDDALLKAILANPADDTVRLVFADWCDENGEGARAEFIRAQVWLWANPSCGSCTGREWCEGRPCSECDGRELRRGACAAALFGRSRWREWSGPARSVIPTGAWWDDHIQFARGFVEAVTCTAADWLTHGDAIRAAHPVTKVVVPNWHELEALYADSQEWAGLASWGEALGDDWRRPSAVRLARWPGVKFELPPA